MSLPNAGTRYLIAHDRYEPPPSNRLLYLELVSWSPTTKEAVYRVATTEGAEVWLGVVDGFASRGEVHEAAIQSTIVNVLEGDTFTLSLDGTPRVVQLEVRRPATGATTTYRIMVTDQGPTGARYERVREAEGAVPFASVRFGEDGRPYLTTDYSAGAARIYVDEDGVPWATETRDGNRAVLLISDEDNRVIERTVLQ